MYIKAYDLINKLFNENKKFKNIIYKGLDFGLIRFFDENEWNKIKSQNFISPINELKSFLDLFYLGFNIGNCVYTSRQLSYSYDNVDLVSGILPILKGTKNSPNGGHVWLESENHIIDTSLMLVIDKSLKNDLGYIEEYRLTKEDLLNDNIYQARKKFINDSTINIKKKTIN